VMWTGFAKLQAHHHRLFIYLTCLSRLGRVVRQPALLPARLIALSALWLSCVFDSCWGLAHRLPACRPARSAAVVAGERRLRSPRLAVVG
jgi:hypothetical protein